MALGYPISAGLCPDADLYVRPGAQPTLTEYSCRPWIDGNNCDEAKPQVGIWHIAVHAYSAFEGVTLKATWSAASGVDDWKK